MEEKQEKSRLNSKGRTNHNSEAELTQAEVAHSGRKNQFPHLGVNDGCYSPERGPHSSSLLGGVSVLPRERMDSEITAASPPPLQPPGVAATPADYAFYRLQ